MLLLMAAFVVMVSWVVSFALQTSSSIQRAMPERIDSEHAAWIAIGGIGNGTHPGGHRGR
jgi:hypothetical protein